MANPLDLPEGHRRTTAPAPPDTFPKLLRQHAEVRGQQPAMREKDLGIWHSWSWTQVADEVRALATKTRESTDEIGQLIGSLQTEVSSSQRLMNTGIERSTTTVQGTEQAFEALNRVVAQIQQIHDHISQVATAAEQQSAVSDTINQNLMRIGDTANVIGQEASSSHQLSEALEQAATALASQLDRLRT